MRKVLELEVCEGVNPYIPNGRIVDKGVDPEKSEACLMENPDDER